MVEGKGIVYRVTIPEGLTSEQVIACVTADSCRPGRISRASPSTRKRSAASPRCAGRPRPRAAAEGSILPETYKFSRGDTRENVLNRMRRERDRVLDRRLGPPRSRPAARPAWTSWSCWPRSSRRRPRSPTSARGRGGVHQPPPAQHAPPVGSDDDLRDVRRPGKAGRLHAQPRRSRDANRPTTPTSSTGCRPDRSPIRAAPRSRRSPIPRAPATSSSSPTAAAVMPSPRPMKSTSATSRAGVRSATVQTPTGRRATLAPTGERSGGSRTGPGYRTGGRRRPLGARVP